MTRNTRLVLVLEVWPYDCRVQINQQALRSRSPPHPLHHPLSERTAHSISSKETFPSPFLSILFTIRISSPPVLPPPLKEVNRRR